MTAGDAAANNGGVAAFVGRRREVEATLSRFAASLSMVVTPDALRRESRRLPAAGITVETTQASSRVGVRLVLPPTDAVLVARALGIDRPVAVSGDVHQTAWAVRTASAPPQLDEHGHLRVATQAPRIGVWDVRIVLAGRPAGPLPAVMSGASPAYDLTESAAMVTAVEIAKAGG